MRIRLAMVVLLCGLLGVGGSLLGRLMPARAAVEPVITTYTSPCKGGTEGNVSTWHGKNRDGKPPYDPNRRTYDFRCVDSQIYTPAAGTVYGVTPKYGGVVLIDDPVNKACMVFLGMKTIALNPKQEVKAGTFVGTYRLFHFSAVDGTCAAANYYDIPSRERERPVQFAEFGEVIPPDIRRPKVLTFTSQNPTLAETVPPTVRLFFHDPAALPCTDANPEECPVALQGIAWPGSVNSENRIGQLEATLTDLFNLRVAEVGDEKLYNALYRSRLTLESVEITPKAVMVYLSGTLRLASADDLPIIQAQITETVRQFVSESEAAMVNIILNGRGLGR